MLFSLAALVEQHPSKLVLHSLVGALTLLINTMTQIEQILCSLSLAWPSRGAQALRVLNQCNQLNLLTKKDIQLIMIVEQHPSKLVLHSLVGALIKRDSVER